MFKAASIPVLLGIAFSQTLPAQTTPTEPYSPTQPVDKTMSQHSLTIYSRAQPGAINPAAFRSDSPSYQPTVPGYAMVRTIREMDLSQSSVEFTDVAASIDPTTVTFKSLSHPNATRVLEQNYRYDLVSTERMLEQFIGQELTLRTAMGAEVETFQGTLMASRSNAIVLELDDGRLVSLADVATISFPNLPGGLITKPTLQWEVATSEPRSQQVEVSYETAGMTWWADYNLLLDETDGCAMDLQAWVSIVNHSGGSFPQARLKLIAGDVNRAPQAQAPRMQTVRRNVSEMAMADDGFKEQSFFEYHLYTLGRPASLPDRSLKQLELFPAALGVECRKQLTFAAGYQPWNVFSEPLPEPPIHSL